MIKLTNTCLFRSLQTTARSSVNALFKANSSTSNENNSLNANVKIRSDYVNKNPRNLEWSGHAYRPLGWHLHYPTKNYYHKCFLSISSRKISARVEHFSGKVIVEVSSTDPEIRKHLVSTSDTSAAMNIARVLAYRCLNYGLTNMHFEKDVGFEKSNKKKIFYETMLKSGIKFEEPEFIHGKRELPGLDYEKKNFYHEPKNLPFPPSVNEIKKKILETHFEKKKVDENK